MIESFVVIEPERLLFVSVPEEPGPWRNRSSHGLTRAISIFLPFD
jgi:hypothetical protein